MRRILCFGDSNTYGYSPLDGQRYAENVRWTGVLNEMLGERFEVINDGKNGRTVAFDDPYNEDCNGMNDIGGAIETNSPLDCVIIMLGTNDLKVYFDSNPSDIAANLQEMCELIKSKTDARIVLVSPALLGDQIEFSPLHLEFGRTQVDYSFELAPAIEKVAKEVGASFVDLALVAVSSDIDCLHLMPEEHAKVAQTMYNKIMQIFAKELEAEAEEERQAELQRLQEEEARQKAEEEARLKAEEEARRQAEEEAERQAEEERLRAKEQAAVPQEIPGTMPMMGESPAQDSIILEGEIEPSFNAGIIGNQEAPSLGGDLSGSFNMGTDTDAEAEAMLKVEAIMKAAEEEVAKEEQAAVSGDLSGSFTESASQSGISGAAFVDIQTGGQVLEPVSGQASMGGESLNLEQSLKQAEAKLETAGTIEGSFVGIGSESAVSESQKQKMLSGKPYIMDAELKAEMAAAQNLIREYNQTTGEQEAQRAGILSSLFQKVGQGVHIEAPFRCDYGSHIIIGDNFYANYDCIMLDTADIKIGNNVFFGPRVSVYAASHPIYAPARNQGYEYSKEVTIGDNVWIGGNVTINPGVHIGSNVVIGSGSVVTGDIPDGVVAAGNPCRIIRRISEADQEGWTAL